MKTIIFGSYRNLHIIFLILYIKLLT